MKKHSFIKGIAVIVAFAIGLLANIAARNLLLPHILPDNMLSLTGFLSLLIQIVVSVVIVLMIGFLSRRGD